MNDGPGVVPQVGLNNQTDCLRLWVGLLALSFYRFSQSGVALMVLLLATSSTPAFAMSGDGGPALDLTIEIAGISLHISSQVGEDGSCCGLLELKLDTEGALVPDFGFLKKIGTQRLQWSF